ncbi:hypothetical protein [Thermococcus sp.]|uniref:hypothetical protein n=1 Tax=Thermococcus sp. TaxID=35749 RepID=UPI002637FE01|nr:hypothetical protein [Thermococcus sp.]
MLALTFGLLDPDFGFKFAVLYTLILSPYILHLYNTERVKLTREYGWKNGIGIAKRLLTVRFSMGILICCSALIGKYTQKNVPTLVLFGLAWALVYAKVLTDADALKVQGVGNPSLQKHDVF